MEKRAFQDQIEPLLQEQKHVRGVYPVVEELKHMGRTKNNRILGNLQGRYQSGKMYDLGKEKDGEFVSVNDTEILKQELYNHPNASHDDLSDAEAYAVETVTVPLGAMSDVSNNHRHIGAASQEDPFAFMSGGEFSTAHEGESFDLDPF